jgi:hypothetical protein
MNRRNFLRILAGAVAAPTVTPFLPPIGGWHSNVIIRPQHWPLMPYSLPIAWDIDDPIGRMIADAAKKDRAARADLVRLAAEQRYFMHAYGGYALHTRTVA